MISYFPEPYEDELFYSMCARYADRMHFPSCDAAWDTLFGWRGGRIDAVMPAHLADLVQRLPPHYPLDVDRFIDDHTLFPFFQPFFTQDRGLALREQMRTGIGKAYIRPERGGGNTRSTFAK